MSKVMTFLAVCAAILGGILPPPPTCPCRSCWHSAPVRCSCSGKVVLLTVPWSLYFQARGGDPRDRAGPLPRRTDRPSASRQAARIARRLRWAAIAAHVVSAGVVAVITLVSGKEIGYYFSGFYLLSTAFPPPRRPTSRTCGYARPGCSPTSSTRTRTSWNCCGRVAAAEAASTRSSGALEELAPRADTGLLRALLEQAQAESRPAGRLDRQMDALGRRFEDTVNRLTDNQEVIAGIQGVPPADPHRAGVGAVRHS
ncbi:hypothetical protein ACU686_27370 [Yinghuangia aomiensis]